MVAIAIDYTPAYEQGGGIGRYVRELTNALAQLDTQTDYRLFVAGTDITSLPTKPGVNFSWHPTKLSTKWLARIWHRARLPLPVELFTGRLALYHATDFVLPPTQPKTRTLLTVHDLSFIRTPETASPRLRQYLTQVVPRSIHSADHILADSTATRSDIMELYNVSDQKITVLLSGVDGRFKPITDTTQRQMIRQKYRIGSTPYLFSIGTIQPRKNYARLVQVLAVLRQRGYDLNLVIAGGKGWLEDEIYTALDSYNVRDHVYFIGFADEEDLPTLYSEAMCTSFVSLYEGFGFPVLESMACGTPVVTSNVSSLPEVAGDAAPMVDPLDVEAMVVEFEKILSDSEYANTLHTRGLQHIKQFTWEQSARQLLDVYHHLLSS